MSKVRRDFVHTMGALALIASALAFAAAEMPATAAESDARPPAAAAPDLVKTAFEALSEADRKAVQDGLLWLGHYSGVVDGSYGKGTRDGVVAYFASLKAEVDGKITAQQIDALKATTAKARASLGFRSVDGVKSGTAISAPLRLLTERAVTAAGEKYTSKDGLMSLELEERPHEDLAALFAKLSAASDARKPTYKVMKKDAFFVVSGEEGDAKFYVRYDRAFDGSSVRGFVLRRPKANAALEKVTLAIANSFSAYPGPSAQRVPEPPSRDEPKTVKSDPPLPPPPRPAEPTLSGAALVVGPGRALTALRESECKDVAVGGKPAKFERGDIKTGLALLTGEFGGETHAPNFGRMEGDLVVLNFTETTPPTRTTLIAAAASADIAASGARIFASLGQGGNGAPIFDRFGRLAGLVAPRSGEPRIVGGVPLAEFYGVIDADAIRGFLGATEAVDDSVAQSPKTSGAIAAERRGAIAVVTCRK